MRWPPCLGGRGFQTRWPPWVDGSGYETRAEAGSMSSIPHLLQFSSVSHLGGFVYNDVISKWRQEGWATSDYP